MRKTLEAEPILGRLYYAINPYLDETTRYMALQLIYGGCDKVGSFRMRGQAQKARANMTSPPPSLVGRKDRLRKVRNAMNKFGTNEDGEEELVCAYFNRARVEEVLRKWNKAGASTACPPARKKGSGAKLVQ